MNETRIMRMRTVTEYTGACSRGTIYRWVADGTFPPPVKIGERMSVWLKDEIKKVVEARVSGLPDKEIKALVKQLVSMRKQERAVI